MDSDTPKRCRTDNTSVEELSIIEMLVRMETKLDLHLAEEKLIRPKLEELVVILERSKGVLVLFRGMLYICAPALAIAYWIRDHVKF